MEQSAEASSQTLTSPPCRKWKESLSELFLHATQRVFPG